MELKEENVSIPTPPAAPEPAKAAAPVAAPKAPVKPPAKPGWIRYIIIAVVIGVAGYFGIPMIINSFNTVSTDDAYVNGYVTFVAPRVSGQILQVLVEDNNRVKKGDVLATLDPEPYQDEVDIKQAVLDTANADLVAAQATVRGMLAQTRSQRFALAHSIEEVDNQVAVIRQRVAKYQETQATLLLSQQEYDRGVTLSKTQALSTEDLDQRKASLDIAQTQVQQALEDIYQARALLGLEGPVPEGDLAKVPDDIDQNFSSVREALADLMHIAAQLGIVPSSYTLTPKETVDEFLKRDPGGNIDKIYQKVYEDAPSIKQSRAAVLKAQKDLSRAQLDLSYCKVISAIDGVVTRRNVNPGNNVQAGQSLMAVRSLKDIWIDANFKETEIGELRIGQKVQIITDAYGSQHPFAGRISGFTFGTGSTLALLPAQNATGNFVKVVQRLPVRIDLINYDPETVPLFTGISVTPVVDIVSPPEGPDKGQFSATTFARAQG